MKKRLFIGCYNKSVILTYLGVLSSCIGIYFSFSKNFRIVFICLIISAICDLFDGMIARKCKRNEIEKQFGVQIDSLSDMVSFVIFPICVLYSISNSWENILIGSLYAVLGITRLAWFNIRESEEESKRYFRGLPVTYTALILAIVYLLNCLISRRVGNIIYQVVFLIMSIAFVGNFKLRKPYGIFYIIYGVLAVISIIGIMFLGV